MKRAKTNGFTRTGNRRAMALFMAALAMGTLLTGCGERAEGTSESGGQSDASSSEEQPSGSQAQEGESSNGQEEREVFKLTTHSNATQGDWNDYWLIKEIEERFNVDIQVEMISTDVWSDKLPLLFASENLPDFFLNSLSVTDITSYGAEGYLLDLSSYISQEKTPNLWAAMEETSALKAAMTQVDDKVYSVCGADMQTRELALNRFYINKDWADQILGKQPENLDEFYEYLKGVKERDMNGNGDPNDEIPLGGYYNQVPDPLDIFYPILVAFGFTGRDLEAIDGRAAWVPAEDNYKPFLEYMNKLSTEGLLHPDYFTQTQDQSNAKETNHLYGAYCYYACWVNQPDETIWREYDGLDPMVSEYNSTQIWPARDFNQCGNFMITKNCSNPEKLMEILDWLFSFEGTLAISAGCELGKNPDRPDCGYTYEWVDDSTLQIDTVYPEDEYDSDMNYNYAEIGPDYGYFPMYRTFTVAQTDAGQQYLTENIVNHYADYYKTAWPSTVKYLDEEANEISLLLTDIESYTDEMVTKMITGEISLDQFETFREGLKARNVDRMMEIHQKAYDRWAESQR